MEHKLSVRERILKTATHLFYAQGIKNTGINQIIAESNVAKASFYQYFPSKHKLIKACLNEYYRSLTVVLRRIVTNSDSLHEFFKKWSRLLKKNATSNQEFMGCPIANIGFQVDPKDKALKTLFNKIIDGWFEIMKPLLEKAVNNKEIPRQKNLKDLFAQVFAINEGVLLLWRLTGKEEYLESLSSALQKLMHAGPDL
ncbi:MAG: TetR/AcrR family transcriptional regulator [Spirochaetales bacterium]|nr:TetR/AcrR family transcriptional regulator [Spirochaetales bacterium]